jgi:hypothetical protein
MSKSTSAPAPITTDHLARIKQDAERGIGASSGDTLHLLAETKRMTAVAYGAHGAFRMETMQERDQLKAENERLRNLLAEKVVTSTMLTGLVPGDGGMTLGFEGGACGMLAQVFGDQFYESKAINYLELRFDSATHPELGSLVVTLQRVEGKTPHQCRVEAEANAERYQKLRDGGYLDNWVNLHVCDEHLRAKHIDQAIDHSVRGRKP